MSEFPQVQREGIGSSETRFVDSVKLFARRFVRELRIVFIYEAQRLLVVSVKNKNPHLPQELTFVFFVLLVVLFRSDYQVPAKPRRKLFFAHLIENVHALHQPRW